MWLIKEQVDLVYLVRTLTMLAQLIPPPKSHFAVVVKSPCIAVKYLYRDSYVCIYLSDALLGRLF